MSKEMWDLRDWVDSLKNELRKANKIIDALPKCWRLNDGELVQDVPVVPGMDFWLKRWFLDHGVDAWRITGPDAVDRIQSDDNDGTFTINDTYGPHACYDSREAAEFALNQVNQEKTEGGEL